MDEDMPIYAILVYRTRHNNEDDDVCNVVFDLYDDRVASDFTALLCLVKDLDCYFRLAHCCTR
jgi:hypothetical protein